MLVHVAVALLVLAAFATFTFDFGVFWLSRRQAQNSADAAAMSGAIALAYDGADTSAGSFAKDAALAVSQANRVWGESPAVNPAVDITFPACPDGTASCVRVDVYRDGAHGNALPIFFGSIVGLVSQGTRATATAQAMTATASDCLKPWIIPDKWEEHYPINPGTWDAETSTFDTVGGKGKKAGPLPNPDLYRPPTSDTMTGFRAEGTPNDIGVEITLKAGQPPQQSGGGAVQPGWVYPVRLNEAEPGGAVYRENIQHCSGDVVKIGDFLRNETGIMVGPTFQGVDPLIAADPSAHWVDPDGPGGEPGYIEGSCQNTGTCSGPYAPSPTRSPRLAIVPVFNTSTFSQTPGAEYLEVVNILGFFIKAREGNNVIGILTTFPGLLVGGGAGVTPAAAFSKTVVLVR